MRTGYIGFDAANRSGHEPVNNLKVRQAMAHAIDRESLVKNLIRGDAGVIHTPCFPTQFGCDVNAAVKYEFRSRQGQGAAGRGRDIRTGSRSSSTPSVRPTGPRRSWAIWPRSASSATLTKMPYFALRDKQRNEGTTPMFLMDWGSYSMNDMSAITSHFFKKGPDDFALDDDVAGWLEAGDTSLGPGMCASENYAKAIAKITGEVYWLPMFNHVRNYGYRERPELHPLPGRDPALLAVRLEVGLTPNTGSPGAAHPARLTADRPAWGEPASLPCSQGVRACWPTRSSAAFVAFLILIVVSGLTPSR